MKKQEGIIIVSLVLTFGAVFLLLLAALSSVILLQHRQSLRKVSWEDSIHIAEAGVSYYRWHLNQTPPDENPDIEDGNNWCCEVGGNKYDSNSPQCQQGGFIVCGPYEHQYYNPQGEETGKFVLTIKAKKICGQVLGVYVISKGSTKKFPHIERTVQAKFASTSVADFAYILNDNVWAGSDRKIYGRYHSNGGIRMDATHNSLVTSSKNDWICSRSFGCRAGSCPAGCSNYGSDCKCPGVVGSGGPQDLWKYPVPPFDFDGITSDLSKIKQLAISKGEYYPPSTDIRSHSKGYHLIFNPDGTYDIRIITNLKPILAYSIEAGWHWSKEKIESEVSYKKNVSLSQDCGLIYIEDNLWIEGTVKGKKTVASANLIDAHKDTTTFINGNLDYTTLDGSDSLALISEKDILIPLYSPNDMVIRGVLVAQKGHFGREHYSCFWYSPECKRDNLLMYGSVVSNGRVGTKWEYSNGSWASGYNQRENYFDEKLSKDPPPLLPYVSRELSLISWEEI